MSPSRCSIDLALTDPGLGRFPSPIHDVGYDGNLSRNGVGQDGVMSTARPKRRSAIDEVRADVAAYVAAGADEDVQKVISAVHRLSRRLNKWYDEQLGELGVSAGEWAVLSELARCEGESLTPSQLAIAANVAPSSMTHRLDRLVSRDLIRRTADPNNRTRVLVQLTDRGWQLFGEAIKGSNLVESDVMAGLDDEQVKNLAALLNQMITGLDAHEI